MSWGGGKNGATPYASFVNIDWAQNHFTGNQLNFGLNFVGIDGLYADHLTELFGLEFFAQFL